MLQKVISVAKMQLKVILRLCLLLCTLATLLEGTSGIPAKRSTFVDDDETIRTEVVDGNNQTILDMFNLTRAQLSRIAAGNSAASKEASAISRDSHYFDGIKDHRLIGIKHQLESVLQGGTSEENQDRPLHEMAAYPICNSESNESSWLHDNNVTIRFSDSLFGRGRDNLNLDSAVLRLYKVNPNGTDEPNVVSIDENQKPKRCTTPVLDSQIRVTVSIVHQRRNKQRKKRICNTIMVNVSQTGWVEIDIKRAIYIWESVEHQLQLQQQSQQQQHQQHQQHHQHQQQQLQQPYYYAQPQQQGRQPVLVGWLLIEVHDEEERPLKPGLFFKPPKCDQADLAIPWNYYGPHSSMSSFALDEVPRSPRLDVKLIGYASFAPKHLQNKELHEQLRFNLRRQLYHLAQSSAELENESTTTFTPTADNLLDSQASTEMLLRHRKRHSHHRRHHRSNNPQQASTDNDSSNNNSQQQQPHNLSTAENVEQQQQQQHTHQHQQHRQHRRHLHHSQHHYQQQQQSAEMHQQLDDC